MSHHPEPECLHRFPAWEPRAALIDEATVQPMQFTRTCTLCGLVEEVSWVRVQGEALDG